MRKPHTKFQLDRSRQNGHVHGHTHTVRQPNCIDSLGQVHKESKSGYRLSFRRQKALNSAFHSCHQCDFWTPLVGRVCMWGEPYCTPLSPWVIFWPIMLFRPSRAFRHGDMVENGPRREITKFYRLWRHDLAASDTSYSITKFLWVTLIRMMFIWHELQRWVLLHCENMDLTNFLYEFLHVRFFRFQKVPH